MKRMLMLVVFVLGALLVAAPLQAYALPVVWQQDSGEDAVGRVEVIRAGMPSIHYPFNVDDGSLDTESDEDVRRTFAAGTYRVRVDVSETIGWSELESEASDFYAEVATYHLDGPLDNELGMLFRYADDDNFYFFAVTSDGYYRLDQQVDGEWVTVIDWQASDAINTGEGSYNLVGLLTEGTSVTLLVNDTVLESVTIDSGPGAGLALGVGTFDDGGVEIAFEDLKLWQLDGGDSGEVVTPEPTETPDAVVTPDPAMVETMIEPVRADDPDYSADFRRDSGDWPTVDEGTTVIALADRALNFNIEGTYSAAWSTGDELSNLNPGDFYLEVDVIREAGAADVEYGVLSRFQDDDNYYFYALNGDGAFALWRVADTLLMPLVDWTESDAILTGDGEVNRLGLWMQGDRIVLLVNDTALAEVQDDTFAQGGIGFYAATAGVGGLDVDFDNLDVWLLAPVDEPATNDDALAAVAAEIDALRATEPDTSERFSRDEGRWSIEPTEDAAYAFVRGRLQIDVTSNEWLAWSESDVELEDFLLQVEALQVSGETPSGEAGVVFRKQDADNFYFFAVDSSGSYSLWKKVDGVWQALVDWTESGAVAAGPDAENRLTILAEGPRLAVMVNDMLLAEVEDASFASGTVALAAGTFADPGYSAAFDNLEIWTLPAISG
jgi:hypothetical protein